MVTTRDDKLAQRRAAKSACTTLRNRLDKAIDQKRDPELLKQSLDNFIEAYDRLMKKCDEVAFFGEEILKAKNSTEDAAKRAEKLEEEKKIFAMMMDELQTELDSIEKKIGEANYPSISLQE